MAMVQFDYDTIRNNLIDRLQKKMQGRILSNSTAMYLIDIFAERLSQIASYTEYLTRESKWSLAQNTSSILTQLELFGYQPHRKRGASGVVEVSADENFASTYQYNILIPKFTRFSSGSLVYCSTEDVVLSNTDQYVKVPVIQGELRTTGEFLGNSFSGDVYTIENDSIENSLYELRNNNIICTQVDWFGQTQVSVNGEAPATYEYNNFEYRIKNLPDFSGIQIEFAPNSHDANDHFTFTYLITEGENGSCFDCWTSDNPNSGITRVVSSVVDSQGIPVKLYVRNKSEISGGTDVQTIDNMRTDAPYSFNRVEKIITYNDYIAAIKLVVPDCLFEIWTEANLRHDNQLSQIEDANDFTYTSKVFFSGVEYDLSKRTVSAVSSEDLYNTITEKLKDKKSLTDYFILKDPDVFKFYLNGKVYFDYNKTNVTLLQSDITQNILDTYSVDKAEFNKSIYRSSYTSLFNGIAGIDHVDVNIVVYTDIPYERNDISITTNKNGEPRTFGFVPAISSEIDLSGQYVFTSVDNMVSSATNRLIKDLFILKYDTDRWNFYTPDGQTLLSDPEDPNPVIEWAEVPEDTDFDESSIKVLNSFKINKTGLGVDIYNALIDRGLICRFVPENFNCIMAEKNQIVIYSDSSGDGISGTLNPWKSKGADNWWWSQPENERDRYGVGLVLIGS